MQNFIAAALACALALITATAAQAANKPNFVLVFMDNLGWGEPGSLNVNEDA